MAPQSSSSPTGFVVVTGAASGIGRAIAEELTERGWAVAWVDSDAEGLTDTSGGTLRIVSDVSQEADWRALVTELQQDWPRLDLLVNSAGVLMGGDLVDSPEDGLSRLLDVNLKGVLLGCRTLGPWLMKSERHRPAGLRPLPGVINLSSVFAKLAPPGFAAYNASKAGVIALSESLRAELAPHGLNVTCAAPGVVRTALFARGWFANAAYREAADRFLEQAQLDPDQVAGDVLHAASRGKPLTVIGGRAWRLWHLKRLFPNSVAKLIARRSAYELTATPTDQSAPSEPRVDVRHTRSA